MSDNPCFILNKAIDVSIEDRPIPELADSRSVKIAVKKTGICGSDVHFYLHGNLGDLKPEEPMVLGHESSGEIVEIGSEVSDLKVGDRVALEPGIPSRYSKEYKMGNYHLCPCMKFAACPNFDGSGVCHGTLCRYYVLPEDFCTKLPDNVSLEEGALVEPLSVAVHAVKQMGVSPCSSAVVFGAGPIGLLCTAVLKAFGCTPIVTVDLYQEKLDFAKQMGATHTFIPSKEDKPEQSAKKIQELMGTKPEFALDASGAEYSITTGVDALCNGGTFMQVANGQKDWIQFAITRMVMKEITFKGTFRYNYGDYIKSVELISTGKVDVKKLITHRVPFNEAEEAYKLCAAGKAVKVVIDGPE